MSQTSTAAPRLFRARYVLLLALAACDGREQPENVAADSAQPISIPTRQTLGIVFDAAGLKPGDQVGELVADSVSAQRAAVDSTYVGTARFRNEITLGGHTVRHPDADLSRTTACFEADSASATRLPRWSGDERRPWFCFENQAEAARSLGSASEGAGLTIVIDNFTIHRGMSDQVNSARFVRVITRGS
jgi:hypothetical protein